jgi:hypothetical protein
MGIACAALIFLSGGTLQTKLPLDPTFGMPIPKRKASKVKLTKDAEWIWTAKTTNDEVAYFRHSLPLDHVSGKFKLSVTADNFFSAYVNGHEVGSSRLSPTDDLVWAKVQTYDITSLLKPGANEICVKATNAGGEAGMLLRVEADGKPILLSDNTWKTTDTNPGENWTSSDFNDSTWEQATAEAKVGEGVWSAQLSGWPVELDSIPDYLAHLKMPPVMVTNAGAHQAWEPANEGMVLKRTGNDGKPWTAVVDFGKELSGRVGISSDSTVSLTHGTGESAMEALEKPWKSTNLDLGSKPGFSPYTSLRYASLTFPASVAEARVHVWMDHLYYPVEYKGSFDCSDPLFTKVWYTGVYTSHLCMQQDIWDAPKRDRARWMGDLHVSGEVINNAFLDRFLMEQTMDRLRQDAQGGRSAETLPGGHVNGIPGYSCAWIAGVADFYRHTGDMDWLKKQHQPLITMLDFLKSELNDGGVYVNNHKQWCFVDWAPHFNGDSPEAYAATHLFLIKAAKEAAFILTELGDSDAAAKSQKLAGDLTETAQAKLLKDGTFGRLRQENAMAIYSGVATADQTKEIYRKILAPGTDAWSQTVSPYYGNYVLDSIVQSGHMADAMKYVCEFWGGMLADGATSWWEGYDPTWPKDHTVGNNWPDVNFHANLQADNGTGYFVSLCHGWSAGPTNFLTERVLGVKSTGGGFRTCEINPTLGSLKWASGTVPTPNGPLKVRVEASASGYKVDVTIPKGVSAKLGPQALHTGHQTVTIPAPADAQ